MFLTLSLTFAFTNNSDEKYWKLLEKAEVAFDAGNLGDAIQFAEIAKNQKKQEKNLIIKEIENALVPTEVNNVGDSIYDIMAVLEKRDEISVLKTLHEVFDLYSIETFNDSMTALLDFLNKQVDYPEVDFLMGKIFIAEGELSDDMQYAWYIYKSEEKEPVFKSGYSIEPSISYMIKESGCYFAKLFVKTGAGKYTYKSEEIRI